MRNLIPAAGQAHETHNTNDQRQELSEAGVHKPTMAGISGSKNGAFSIVMAGAYEDSTDDGETLYVVLYLLFYMIPFD